MFSLLGILPPIHMEPDRDPVPLKGKWSGSPKGTTSTSASAAAATWSPRRESESAMGADIGLGSFSPRDLFSKVKLGGKGSQKASQNRTVPGFHRWEDFREVECLRVCELGLRQSFVTMAECTQTISKADLELISSCLYNFLCGAAFCGQRLGCQLLGKNKCTLCFSCKYEPR